MCIRDRTGGVAPYTYSFNGSAFSATVPTPTGLAAGPYALAVKDANGCELDTTVNINNTGGPTALAVASTPAACGLPTGTVTIGAPTGGVAPYTLSLIHISEPTRPY